MNHVILIFAVVSIPIWGWISSLVSPEVSDPLSYRLWLAGIIAGLWLLHFKAKNPEKAMDLVIALASSLIMIHVSYIITGAPTALVQTVGAMLVMAVVFGILSARSHVLIFAAVCITCTIWIVFHQNTGLMILWMLASPTTIFVGSFSAWNRIKTIHLLGQSEAQFSKVFSTMQEGIILQDKAGAFISMNPAAPRILGLSTSDILGKNPWDPMWRVIKEDGSPFPPNELPAVRCLEIKKPITNVIMGVEKPNGSRVWLNVSCAPIRKDHSDEIIGSQISFGDITAIKAQEKLIDDQRTTILQSAKLSALGEMAAGIAHEINNPMAVISGRINQLDRALAKETPDIQQARAMVQKIFDMIERVTQIISSMRSFTRDSSLDPFSLASTQEITDNTLILCKEKFSAQGIDLQVLVKDHGISCRPNQITQVLMNLLSNSLDAVQSLDTKWVKLEGRLLDRHYQFSVTDSGSGIPTNHVDRIMTPFFTTKDPGKGTGLGLSISNNIVASHKGRFFYDTSSAHTRFVLEIPCNE